MVILKAKLLALKKAEERAHLDELRGDVQGSWGDQMRNYVLHPYQMVKDLRTDYETGNPQAVFDGDIDGFLEAGIRWRRGADSGRRLDADAQGRAPSVVATRTHHCSARSRASRPPRGAGRAQPAGEPGVPEQPAQRHRAWCRRRWSGTASRPSGCRSRGAGDRVQPFSAPGLAASPWRPSGRPARRTPTPGPGCRPRRRRCSRTRATTSRQRRRRSGAPGRRCRSGWSPLTGRRARLRRRPVEPGAERPAGDRQPAQVQLAQRRRASASAWLGPRRAVPAVRSSADVTATRGASRPRRPAPATQRRRRARARRRGGALADMAPNLCDPKPRAGRR